MRAGSAPATAGWQDGSRKSAPSSGRGCQSQDRRTSDLRSERTCPDASPSLPQQPCRLRVAGTWLTRADRQREQQRCVEPVVQARLDIASLPQRTAGTGTEREHAARACDTWASTGPDSTISSDLQSTARTLVASLAELEVVATACPAVAQPDEKKGVFSWAGSFAPNPQEAQGGRAITQTQTVTASPEITTSAQTDVDEPVRYDVAEARNPEDTVGWSPPPSSTRRAATSTSPTRSRRRAVRPRLRPGLRHAPRAALEDAEVRADPREIASFSRLIEFDKRGTGMSDPVSGAPTLETRMDDVRAVMDAVGSSRAAYLGFPRGRHEHTVRRDLPGAHCGARRPQRLSAHGCGLPITHGADGRGVRARGRARAPDLRPTRAGARGGAAARAVRGREAERVPPDASGSGRAPACSRRCTG